MRFLDSEFISEDFERLCQWSNRTAETKNQAHDLARLQDTGHTYICTSRTVKAWRMPRKAKGVIPPPD